jgi:hypothetical protein
MKKLTLPEPARTLHKLEPWLPVADICERLAIQAMARGNGLTAAGWLRLADAHRERTDAA